MQNNSKYQNKNYLEYVKAISPRTKQLRSLFRAFWVGGLICCIGQGIRMLLGDLFNLEGDELSAYVSMIMILISWLLLNMEF